MAQRQSDVAAMHTLPWPPDDTEESVMGSEYHQHVIDAARDGLRMAKRANAASWDVLSQVPLAGFRRPDGSPYQTYPDVFVHPRPNPRPASGLTLTLAEVGVPLLVIEVLSASTQEGDLDEERGKAWSYADAGVAAYIVVDYGRQYMREHVRALRLHGRRWQPWRANEQGRWESAALGVSFEFDGLYLRVRDAAGRLTPLPQEAHALLIEQAAALEAQTAALEQIRALAAAGDLAALRAFLARSSPDDPPATS
jgi:hypothetical protein